MVTKFKHALFEGIAYLW